MLSTKYRDLSPKAKDRIYKQFQRLKVKKDIVRNRSFYSKEDYIPVPVADVAKIMKALNDSLSPSYPRVQFSKHNPNFLYDFLKVTLFGRSGYPAPTDENAHNAARSAAPTRTGWFFMPRL